MKRATRKETSKRQKSIALRYISGECSQQELAEEYGVSQSTISRDIKFGGLMILAECGINTHDSILSAEEKAVNAGYENPKAVVKLLTDLVDSIKIEL